MNLTGGSGRIISTSKFIPEVYNLGETDHPELFWGLDFPWDVIARIPERIESLLPTVRENFTMHCERVTIGNSAIVGPDVFLSGWTEIEPGAIILGPAYIGMGCKILAGARIRENVILGPYCEIGTEISNSYLGRRVKARHHGHIGHSIVGNSVNFGAGATISNRRNTLRGCVYAYLKDGLVLSTGTKKYGAIVGAHCQIGCNVVINPGVTLSRNVVVDDGVSVRKFVDPYTRVRNTRKLDFEKMIGSALRDGFQNGGR